ncbi:MAG: hypothetical protein ABSH56_31470 [Bryobacteraceae bacterium]|jgi:uncharacterized protein (TIGR03437 family)
MSNQPLRFYSILSWTILCAGASTAPVYTIASIAGSNSLGDGGPAIAAQIGTIQGVAVDLSGNVYVSDTDHQRVRKIGSAGTISTIAGTGVAGYSGDGGPATAAELNLPYGLAVDLAGDVYVADLGNNRVRKISPQGTISTVAGTGTAGSAGDGAPAVNAQLNAPRNLLLDGFGNLYISEFSGHRVRKVTAGVITTFAGTGVAGFRGDGGLAIAAELDFPCGLATDATGALYVADSGNQRVRKILGSVIGTVLGGVSATQLATPVAVAVDPSLTLYVADGSDTVHSYSQAGGWKVAAGTGTVGFSGDGGPASLATLTMPHDLAFDLGGDLLLADGDRVREINGQGVIETVAGDDYLHALGDNGPAQDAILLNPNAVALDSAGNLYIADSGTNRVRHVLPSGVIQTLAGTGNAGYNADGGTAATAALNGPLGVATGAGGSIVVADSGNQRVRLIAASLLIQTVAGSGTAGQGPAGLPATNTNLDGPGGVCSDGGNNIYVADTLNNRVLRIPAGGLTAAAAGAGFSAGYGGDGGPAAEAKLNQPSTCAVDVSGNLFIADTGNNAIREVTTDGQIHTVAGIGTAGNSGDEGPATAATLNAPSGVAVDAYGDVYIADTGNDRLRMITADGILHTIAGQGTAGFGGDGGSALAALLNAPAGLSLDSSGNVYFADRGNNRVRMLIPGTPVTAVSLAPSVSVVNAASLAPGSVAPGELVTIAGDGIGPAVGVFGTIGPSGSMPTDLGGVEVDFDGVAGPLLYVQASQINAQVPYAVSGRGITQIEVQYQGQVAGSALETVAQAAPGLFPVVINQDGSINSSVVPAPAGSVVTLFGTGEGLTNGPNQAGLAAAAPYPQPLLGVGVSLGQTSLPLPYAGSAPGAVGLLQVNCTLPVNASSGTYPLVLSVGSFLSPSASLWIK